MFYINIMYYFIFVNLFCILYFRYKLKVRVIDDTDSTTFVLFDRDATTLINKSFLSNRLLSQSVFEVLTVHLEFL